MPPDPLGPLVRTNYLSSYPGPYVPEADPNNAAFDPAAVIPQDGIVVYGDIALDVEQYHRPLEQLHGSGLHAAGVAYGMALTCVIGHQTVTIQPGLALDGHGRHIYLAEGGQAEIGPSSGNPNPPPDLTPVPASGAVLPTTGLPPGEYYMVVQWRETWDAPTYASDPNISQFNDTPWLQLVTAADYLPALQVILGAVTLDANGNVTAASYGTAGGSLQRTSVSLPAQGIELQRAASTAAGAETVSWGAVRAREAGGVEIAVAKDSDQVEVFAQAGGTFSALTVAADTATIGEPTNPGITLSGEEATIFVGATDNYGDVLVYDGSNHYAVSLVGRDAQVIVGGETLNGQVRMKNANAEDTMTLDGDVGSATVQRLTAFANNLIDVDTALLHVHGTDIALDGRSHNNNRALVDGGEKLIINYAGDYPDGVEINSALAVDNAVSSGGVPIIASPVRKALSITLDAQADWSGSPSASFTFNIGHETQLTAFAFFTYQQYYVDVSYNAMAVAEIYQIDGQTTPSAGSQADLGTLYTPCVINEKGSTVTFRVRAADDSIAVQATAVVFYE
jgi:hypothetical protein